MKEIKLNEGAQKDFVTSPARFAAYIGGIGSGKTFAGIVRGLDFAQKYPGSRGLCGAISYTVMKDVVLPQFYSIIEGTGLLDRYIKSEKRAILSNGSEILFRSLDEPDKIRGIELAWFFVDEGRHVDKEAFDVLIGRLRQRDFPHSGWVASTPNGFDWMWDIFSPDSPNHYEDAEWFNASTLDNRRNLPASYINSLQATWSGKWYEQEVEGKFVGLMSGGAFPHWIGAWDAQSVRYDPDLPLYSFWDFGIGDNGVCLFAQVRYVHKDYPEGAQWVPELRFLDIIEHKDWGPEEWALAWKAKLDEISGGRRPKANYGDPAGKQRAPSSKTSVIDAMDVLGVPIIPAKPKPIDLGLIILDNMMADGRLLLDKDKCARLGTAFASHHFATDDKGNRTGPRPVHDWTSHFCDAARYGVTELLSLYPTRTSTPPTEPPGPGTMGYIVDQIMAPQESGWLGRPNKKRVIWHPSQLG